LRLDMATTFMRFVGTMEKVIFGRVSRIYDDGWELDLLLLETSEKE